MVLVVMSCGWRPNKQRPQSNSTPALSREPVDVHLSSTPPGSNNLINYVMMTSKQTYSLETSISLRLYMTRYLSLHKGGWLLEACVFFLDKLEHNLTIPTLGYTDNYTVFMCLSKVQSYPFCRLEAGSHARRLLPSLQTIKYDFILRK